MSPLTAPTFKWQFLLPRYWLTWLGIILLYIISWLPLFILSGLARVVAFLLTIFAKRRVDIARQNLELTWPSMADKDREILLKKHLHRAGMAIFETAIGWWAPRWRIEMIASVEGYEHVEAILKQGKGVFGLAIHNMNLEIACRVLGYQHPGIAFYRKHNNPLIDYMQYHGRNQSNKYMIDKRNAKLLVAALDEGDLCLYLPDQDYGRAQSIFVPFGAVKQTATTSATLMFARKANCIPLMVAPQFTATGYKVKFYPPMPEFADKQDEQALTELNSSIEDIVLEQPESYLWMHKRFKTRPHQSDPSLYN